MEERQCYESQIIEFGQTPKQIFTKQHPKRTIRNMANQSSQVYMSFLE